MILIILNERFPKVNHILKCEVIKKIFSISI